jgi:hypothetical protein
MFSLTVILEDDTGGQVDAVVSAYTTTNRTLVAREASVAGSATLDLVGDTAYIITATTLALIPSTVVTVDEGLGEITMVTQPRPLIDPIGPRWCSVEGRLVDSSGGASRANIRLFQESGEGDSQIATVLNRSSEIQADELGNVRFQLLRGTTYSVTLHTGPLEVLPENFIINVPELTQATFYDIFFPHAVGVVLDRAYDGVGTYGVKVVVSDGTETDAYPNVNLLIAVISENANAEFVDSGGVASLEVSDVQAGGRVELHGTRRGSDSTSARVVDTSRRGPLIILE